MHPLVHFGNLITLAAYAVTDVLWLRMLAVAANASVVYYSAVVTPFDWQPVAWYSVFTGINTAQAFILWHKRRPVQIAEDAQALYAQVFGALAPGDFMRLWAESQWQTTQQGSALIEAGTHPDSVYLVSSGKFGVHAHGDQLAVLQPGQFAGEMSFMTNQPPAASVVALETSVVRAFPRVQLRQFMAGSAQLSATIQLVLGTDVVSKLKSMRPKQPSRPAQA